MATSKPTVQDLYIQFCGSWLIGATTPQAHADMLNLPEGRGNNGREFALYLRDNQLGKRVSNLQNLLPELQQIALSY